MTDIWKDVGNSFPRELLCFFSYKTAFFPFPAHQQIMLYILPGFVKIYQKVSELLTGHDL